jgi:hypothetical protein
MKNIFITIALAGVDVLKVWKSLFNILEPKAYDWFNLLPNHIRIKAVRNARINGTLFNRYCSLADAINQSFNKTQTIEGELYWQRVIDKYTFSKHKSQFNA